MWEIWRHSFIVLVWRRIFIVRDVHAPALAHTLWVCECLVFSLRPDGVTVHTYSNWDGFRASCEGCTLRSGVRDNFWGLSNEFYGRSRGEGINFLWSTSPRNLRIEALRSLEFHEMSKLPRNSQRRKAIPRKYRVRSCRVCKMKGCREHWRS